MLTQEAPVGATGGKCNTSHFNELTPRQVALYHQQGYLHIPAIFTLAEIEDMSADMDWMIDQWAIKDQGWTGPWRKAYMDAGTEKKSQLIAMHDLQYYSAAWARAVSKPKLVATMADLLGNLDQPSNVVELHHSTMHVKPPETGHPFPMHQDWAFYKHADNRYVDVLVHLDDTQHANGEIRFLAGSHQQGPLEHITTDPETGKGCTPHLPTDRYRLADTVAVPAKRGDIVVFNIFTIHGSYMNTTDRNRRLVRVGFKHPENVQSEGQSKGRSGWTVWGRRPHRPGQMPFGQDR